MPGYLTDLASQADWDADLAAGFIRRSLHPTLPLALLNYLPKAQYERAWRATTRAARGLIVHAETGEILARPYAKFFNAAENGAPSPALDARVRVTDKVDGSLGVLYPVRGGQFAVATRGSFTSEQARHATRVWQQRYASRFTPREGLTYLFEIVYRGSRVVIDYQGLDDLVLLDVLDTATGATVLDPTVLAAWPGPAAQTYPHTMWADVLTADIPDGREGFVVHLLDTDERLKIKAESYLRLHRLMTDVSTLDVWANLAVARMVGAGMSLLDAGRFTGLPPARVAAIAAAGEDWLAPLIDAVPDEYFDWITDRITEMEAAIGAYQAEAQAAYAAIGLAGDPADRSARKEIAAAIARAAGRDKERHAVFIALLDGRSLLGFAFRACRPAQPRTFWNEPDAA